jgi:hypothetical protein
MLDATTSSLAVYAYKYSQLAAHLAINLCAPGLIKRPDARHMARSAAQLLHVLLLLCWL